MDQPAFSDEILNFIKAVVDEDRLKILGVLAKQNASLDELAQQTALHPGRVAHKLQPLLEAGVVKMDRVAGDQVYELDIHGLEAFAREQLTTKGSDIPASTENLAQEDLKVVKSYTDSDGRLKQIPTKPKSIRPILNYIYPSFEPGRRYTEKEVNQVLSRFHPDVTTLRRYLIDYQFLGREVDGSAYWCLAALPEKA